MDKSMVDLAIRQTRNSDHPRRMKLAMVAISLDDALITAHTPNRILHDDPAAGERGVVALIFEWAVLASRFATGSSTQGMEGIDPDVSEVTHPADAFGQAWQQTGLLQPGKPLKLQQGPAPAVQAGFPGLQVRVRSNSPTAPV